MLIEVAVAPWKITSQFPRPHYTLLAAGWRLRTSWSRTHFMHIPLFHIQHPTHRHRRVHSYHRHIIFFSSITIPYRSYIWLPSGIIWHLHGIGNRISPISIFPAYSRLFIFLHHDPHISPHWLPQYPHWHRIMTYTHTPFLICIVVVPQYCASRIHSSLCIIA